MDQSTQLKTVKDFIDFMKINCFYFKQRVKIKNKIDLEKLKQTCMKVRKNDNIGCHCSNS